MSTLPSTITESTLSPVVDHTKFDTTSLTVSHSILFRLSRTRSVARTRLNSEGFEEGAFIRSQFTRGGEDFSPEPRWWDVPEEASSFALSMTEPNALGGTFIQLLVYSMVKTLNREPKLDNRRLSNEEQQVLFPDRCLLRS